MPESFATASDLASRLKRPVWTDPAELAQVEAFLDDASNDLRSEIGWQVYPPVDVTVDVTPDASGHVRLPGTPVADVTAVSQYGAALPDSRWEWTGGLLHLTVLGAAAVTYTVGYEEAPAELLRWTCVIAAQRMTAAADDDFGGGTPSSESLADWRVSYSKRQQEGDLPVPDRVLERLRSTYGTSVYVTS